MSEGYSRAEVRRIAQEMSEGKSFFEASYGNDPNDEYTCLYKCAMENMKSLKASSMIKTLYYELFKKDQPTYQPALRDCTKCCSV